MMKFSFNQTIDGSVGTRQLDDYNKETIAIKPYAIPSSSDLFLVN